MTRITYLWSIFHVVFAFKVRRWAKKKDRKDRGKTKAIIKKRSEGGCAEIVAVWPEASWAEQRWSLSLTAWIPHTLHHTNSMKPVYVPHGSYTQCLRDRDTHTHKVKHKTSLLARPLSDWFGIYSVLILITKGLVLNWRLNKLCTKTLFMLTTFIKFRATIWRMIPFLVICAEQQLNNCNICWCQKQFRTPCIHQLQTATFPGLKMTVIPSCSPGYKHLNMCLHNFHCV